MQQFQLSKKAKADLRSIALFTENRWGRPQRNLYIKQLDDAFLCPRKSQRWEFHATIFEMDIKNFRKAAASSFTNTAVQPVF